MFLFRHHHSVTWQTTMAQAIPTTSNNKTLGITLWSILSFQLVWLWLHSRPHLSLWLSCCVAQPYSITVSLKCYSKHLCLSLIQHPLAASWTACPKTWMRSIVIFPIKSSPASDSQVGRLAIYYLLALQSRGFWFLYSSYLSASFSWTTSSEEWFVKSSESRIWRGAPSYLTCQQRSKACHQFVRTAAKSILRAYFVRI